MKIATREAFGEALKELVIKNNDVIVLDADLSPATKTCYAKEARPQQFYSTGIAEANMVGIGAGLAVQGLKPFVSSFAMFLAGRAFEQIRNSIAYPHLNVKLCATHAGLTVGEDGATHQCNEDIALMRVLPGMVVLQPCDANETKAMMQFMVDYDGPVYLRTSRYAVDNILDSNYKFLLGEIVPIVKGCKIAFLETGIMVNEARKAIEILAKLKIDFPLSFYIFLNVRKALFYQLYGHFSFRLILPNRHVSSRFFMVNRGKYRGKTLGYHAP